MVEISCFRQLSELIGRCVHCWSWSLEMVFVVLGCLRWMLVLIVRGGCHLSLVLIIKNDFCWSLSQRFKVEGGYWSWFFSFKLCSHRWSLEAKVGYTNWFWSSSLEFVVKTWNSSHKDGIAVDFRWISLISKVFIKAQNWS